MLFLQDSLNYDLARLAEVFSQSEERDLVKTVINRFYHYYYHFQTVITINLWNEAQQLTFNIISNLISGSLTNFFVTIKCTSVLL